MPIPKSPALLVRFVLETKTEAIPEIVRREGIRSLLMLHKCVRRYPCRGNRASERTGSGCRARSCRNAAEALAAFMLGIEAVCRLSKAISVAPANGDIAWSQTGVTCGVGAALAAARLLQLGPETARMAVGIAAGRRVR
jgi:hypothetical protein